MAVPRKHQHEVGWECPHCHKRRGQDGHDPCLGELPGVLFACCGHGGILPGYRDVPAGYIYFENGVIVRFSKLTEVTKE